MIYKWIIEILLLLIILQIILVIIMENRNPYKTATWIIILTFLPVLGLILYIFFGEETRRKYRIWKKLDKDIEDKHPWVFLLENADPVPRRYSKLAKMLTNINNSVVLGGNEVRFYSDGACKFKQFFEDIANAKHHIHILYYKIIGDRLGCEFKDLLIKKAQEGVEVRVLYDDVGSLSTKKVYFDEMKKGGVEVEVFLSVRFPRLAHTINYRNHKKLAVIDGIIGYVGGMNVENCYVDGVSWGVWRDMQVRIYGKGAHGLQRNFFKDWYSTHKSLPEYSEKYYPKVESYGNNPMQIVTSGPLDRYGSIERGIFEAISNAHKSIYIQTPYFVPSEAVLYALQTAAVSGVDVNVMMPKKSDNVFLDGANLSYVSDLLSFGIHVYLFHKGFVHSKCLVIDGSLTIMGSANMDIRSFELSFETNTFIYDEDTAKKAIDIFHADAQDSFEVKKEDWEKRSIWKRLFQSVLRLFTPVL